jgi:hypothetical protein
MRLAAKDMKIEPQPRPWLAAAAGARHARRTAVRRAATRLELPPIAIGIEDLPRCRNSVR